MNADNRGNATLGDVLGIEFPPRSMKPRSSGLTMVMDQAWPTNFVAGMMEAFGPYLDVVKLWDPHLRQAPEVVEAKIAEYRKHDVWVQPGGIWLEIAKKSGKGRQLIDRLEGLGFNSVEVSSTTEGRVDSGGDAELVEYASSLGFTVFGEVGRKFPDGDRTRISARTVDIERTVDEFNMLLKAGAWKVYWEGHLLREVMGDDPDAIHERSGSGTRQVVEVAEEVGLDHIFFETSGLRPRSNRQWLQFWLIRVFGPEVNIANARIEELGNLEALRAGCHPIFGFGSAGNYPWLSDEGMPTRDAWWRA